MPCDRIHFARKEVGLTINGYETQRREMWVAAEEASEFEKDPVGIGCTRREALQDLLEQGFGED